MNHDESLRKLLDRAREVNLKLNSKTINSKKPKVKFMGHVMSKDGLKPDKAVENMPKPTCKKETLSLFGFINYLAKFLARLSEVAHPLRNLTLTNTQFIWSEQHDKAFDEVKKLQWQTIQYSNITTSMTRA